MLSKKTQYSINALVRLAKYYKKGPLLIKEIAEMENIPKKFLEGILLDLKNKGILASKRGKGGGYYLRKNPEDINLADIIRHFDGAIALLPCASTNFYESCEQHHDENTCGVRSVFKEIRDKTANYLRNTTLKDIMDRERELLKKYY